MSVCKRGKFWWYRFTWNGKRVCESTRQSNKRVADEMEAVRRSQLAKGEAGIKDHKVPTLARFMHDSFLPFVEATKSGEPSTVAFYKKCCKNLLRWAPLADCRISQIESCLIAGFIAHRQETPINRKSRTHVSAATINRELATLRRALKLAHEWGKLPNLPSKIRPLDGEICRERVITPSEESAYLKTAEPLMRDVAAIILDCGLRPDEVYRLKWNENYRDKQIIIHTGKTKAARRAIPITWRVGQYLEMRQSSEPSVWMFPARTKTGHINQSSLKTLHRRACKDSGVKPFVLYELRHTCLTRWARHLDPFTLKKLAGHESLETTMKYIHLNESDSAARLKEARSKLHDDEWKAVEEMTRIAAGMDAQ